MIDSSVSQFAAFMPNAIRVLALLGALLAPVAATAAAGMQPGLWELAITVDIAGRAQTIPTGQACITQSDIDDATRTLPRPEGSCTLSNVQRTAERATYDLTCNQNAITTHGKAQVDFAGDRYDGKVDMMMTGKGAKPLHSLMTLAAVRVGDCSK